MAVSFSITPDADYSSSNSYVLTNFQGSLPNIDVDSSFSMGLPFTSPFGYSIEGTGVTTYLFYPGSGNLNAASGGYGLDFSDGTGNANLGGGDFADYLAGGAGSDHLVGNGGNDLLDGGAGSNLLDGGAGIDTARFSLVGDAVVNLDQGYGLQWDVDRWAVSTLVAVENLTGGSGDDRFTGNSAANVLTGGVGDDTLDGGLGNDILTGGLNNDTLIGGGGIDTASYADAASGVTVRLAITSAQNTLGAGYDSLGGVENVTGSALADNLQGDNGDNTLTGGEGDDQLLGGLGNDYLVGGAGIDTASYATATGAVKVDLSLTASQNTVSAGSDRLVQVENLRGSAYSDALNGNALNNNINGAEGNDIANGNGGNDTLSGGAGVDTFHGNDGNDRLSGGDDNDRLYGDAGADNITGEGGSDAIYGGDDKDTINGGDGNDLIYGGGGADQITGGAGADRFVYETVADSSYAATSRDKILDFSHSEGDRINLTAIDAKPGGADDAFKIVAAFTGAGGELRITASGGDWLAAMDLNGDKVADMGITVVSSTQLVASDFFL